LDHAYEFEDSLHRSELYSFIVDLVKSTSHTLVLHERAVPAPSPGGTGHAAPVKRAGLRSPFPGSLTSQAVLPRVTVIDRSLRCNGITLDLARRPSMLRLFQTFVSTPDLQLGRDELLKGVYGKDLCTQHSRRYCKSLESRLIKMMSRARMLVCDEFGAAVNRSVEWLVFDQEKKVWCLYRVRTPYLLKMLGFDA